MDITREELKQISLRLQVALIEIENIDGIVTQALEALDEAETHTATE